MVSKTNKYRTIEKTTNRHLDNAFVTEFINSVSTQSSVIDKQAAALVNKSVGESRHVGIQK